MFTVPVVANVNVPGVPTGLVKSRFITAHKNDVGDPVHTPGIDPGVNPVSGSGGTKPMGAMKVALNVAPGGAPVIFAVSVEVTVV
jgi:hypothetical protein